MTALRQYIASALWTGLCYESEEDDNPDPLDRWVDIDDVDAVISERLLGDLEDFSRLVEESCPEAFDKVDEEQMAHDFHLTRNHHGAGFWDRGLGELGDRLTDLAQSFGPLELEGHRDTDGIVAIFVTE